SYLRTLRQIVEEPDIEPGGKRAGFPSSLGNTLGGAIALFSLRTLSRSRQHRITLAFYLGIAFGFSILLLKSSHGATGAAIYSSMVSAIFWIAGTRIVFSVPHTLQANWIFRLLQVRSVGHYLRSVRQPLWVLSAVPFLLAAAVVFLGLWPRRAALMHLAILALVAAITVELCLLGFRKIPFACSYLPGKSNVNMAFLAAGALIQLVGSLAHFELESFDDLRQFGFLVAILITALVLVRTRSEMLMRASDAVLIYEESAEPEVYALNLHRDGVTQF
ncbi:MAG TPA: hypothetical protein VNH18_22115, partial [Bryobacteraceae bacterium]|nr:hypothetical protein [Bryobacteraceae bacterium]